LKKRQSAKQICTKQAQKTNKFLLKQAQKQATRKSSNKPANSKKQARIRGVKRNFWPLRNFWPVIVIQLFCFSKYRNKVWQLLFWCVLWKLKRLVRCQVSTTSYSTGI